MNKTNLKDLLSKDGATIIKLAKKNMSMVGSLLGLVALIIVASIVSGGSTLEFTNIQNLMRQVTVLGFASLGMTIVILTGNIDLSIIGNLSMATVLTAVLMNMAIPMPIIVVAVILASALVGVLNGLILSFWKIESFVVTMGMQVVCFGLALMFSSGATVIVDSQLMQTMYLSVRTMGTAKILGIPTMFVILVALYVVVFILSKKTKIGRSIFALGGSEEVCYMSGVNVNFVRTMAYTLSGACAGIAGIFMFIRSVAGDPTAGNALGMFTVAAVVVGGTKMSGGRGSILFTITGIFIIQLISNTLNIMGAPYQVQQVIQGIIILFAVIISSSKRKV